MLQKYFALLVYSSFKTALIPCSVLLLQSLEADSLALYSVAFLEVKLRIIYHQHSYPLGPQGMYK